MNGCRRLTDNEIELVLPKLHNSRDKCLFLLGVFCGYRISELLSLRVSDISDNRVTVMRSKMKGKKSSRSIPLHPRAKQAVMECIQEYGLTANSYLFRSRQGDNKAISRDLANKILKQAFNRAGLTGRLSSHSLRKTLAHKVYEASGRDIRAVQVALRHQSLSSTTHYLGIEETEVDNLIMGLK